MRPPRAIFRDDDPPGPILAVGHPVARWIMTYASRMPPSFRKGDMATVAPDYRKADPDRALEPLAAAAEEASFLSDRFDAEPIRGTRAAVTKLLHNEAGQPYTFVLFAWVAGIRRY